MKWKLLISFTILVTIFVFVFLGAATVGLAATEETSGDSSGSDTVSGGSNTISNPLGSVDDPREIIGNVIKAMLGIVGSLALLIFIFGGFTWVTSAGNDEKIKKGKDMITWAAFGLVVIFLSYALVTFVISAITGESGGSGSTGDSGVGQGAS